MKNKFILTYSISALLFLISSIIYGVLGLTHVIDFKLYNLFASVGGMIIVFLPWPFLKLFKIEVNLLTIIFYEFQIIIAMLIGTTWNMYDIWPFYDKVVHALGGLLITLICYSVFISKNRDKNISPLWLIIVAFSMSMMVGAVWEIWEFSSDAIFGFNTQRYSDNITGVDLVGRAALMDTMTDIVANTIGAVIACVAIYFMEKKLATTTSINSNIAEVVLEKGELTEIIKNVAENSNFDDCCTISNNVNIKEINKNAPVKNKRNNNK